MPLEYNVLGMMYNERYKVDAYPNSRFWKIASQYKNKAIIGMDSHQPFDLNKKNYMKALDNLSKYNVEIIDDIKRVDYLAIKAKKALNNLEF